MSTKPSMDADRVQVTVYVTDEQKAAWDDHAEQLGISQSRFIRQMVQAGRRKILEGESNPTPHQGRDMGESLEDRIIGILSSSEYLSWDELIDSLTDNIEERLEDTLDSLQSDNRIRYSGKNGGYTLAEDDER